MDDITNTAAVEEEQPEVVRNFATVGAVYEDGVSLIFDGETEPSEKHYLCNTNVFFSAGDRVRILSDSGTYVVEYIVGSPRQDRLVGIPSGGDSGQVLGKSSSNDFDAAWLSPRYVPSSGNTGYLLTKTENGYAWASAPVEIPSGGSNGQVLTKTSGGYGWSNLPSQSVNEVPTGGTTGQVLTKTASGYGWSTLSLNQVPSSGTTGYVLTKTSTGYGWAALSVNEVPSSGTTGYVLTKTTSGYGWAAISHPIPSTGTTGHVLTKTSTGTAWSAAPTPTRVSKLINSYQSSNTNYDIEIRSTSTYYASSPVFQIRMSGSSTWKTITIT